jgi:hypothetical protein
MSEGLGEEEFVKAAERHARYLDERNIDVQILGVRRSAGPDHLKFFRSQDERCETNANAKGEDTRIKLGVDGTKVIGAALRNRREQ